MKRTALFIIAVFSIAAFSPPLNGQGKNLEDSKPYKQLMPVALSILEGNYSPKLKDNISPEAYLINNNTYESLFEVLGNPEKRKTFIEDKNTVVEFSQIIMPDDKTTAYVIFETKSENITNWHTIFFEIGKNKKWQVVSWHKS